MPRWILAFLPLCWIFFGAKGSQIPEYLEITAQAGDGILALLRKYQLSVHECNLPKFCELNGITPKSALIKGKKYLLPIELHHFNGKTIRSSVGVKDFAVAKRIQQYNEAMLDAKVRKTAFQKDLVLWAPYHLLHCKVELIKEPAPAEFIEGPQLKDFDFVKESNPGKRRFPIFGPTLAYTPLLSRALAGRIYYIDAGHGGNDPGAIGKYGKYSLCEDEYAYDVALRLCRKLVEHGAIVYMITRDPNDGIRGGKILLCDSDERVWGGDQVSTSQSPRLFQRSNIINALFIQNSKLGKYQQVSISIHVDSRIKKQQVDLFFYYQKDKEESIALAKTLHRTMKSKYSLYRKGGGYRGTVSHRDLHMLRETKPTAIYMELGNIRNPIDQQRVVLETNREALAKWLYDGLSK
jgi:N-acetylmuramoyl-L-alanine amidase